MYTQTLKVWCCIDEVNRMSRPLILPEVFSGEAEANVIFDKALEIAQLLETVEKDTRDLQHP